MGKARNKKLVFKIIAILIPFIILLCIEGILRFAGYGDNFSLFIQDPQKGYEKYMMVNPDIGKKYFQKFEYSKPSNDIFYKEKPVNTFRIFVMGSSTVVGFPYDNNLMFSRILNKQLDIAFPDKKIEVVNTAITAINSFTLLDYTDQILKYEPDAIIIYAGHNEFYGAFGIGSNETMSKNRNLTRLHIALMNFKIYQLLKNIISGITQKMASHSGNETEGTLMKRIVANKNIPYNSDEYNIAIERYRQNMDAILKKIKKKDIPVFFSEVVSNVKDIEPLSSVSDGESDPAYKAYKNAKIAEENHDYEKAKELYYKAKDLDGIRFRASEDINKIVDELSKKYDTHLVPMLSWFQNHSPNGLIGNNLITEHVHPNSNGYFLMAEEFFNEILKTGIIGTPVLSQKISPEYLQKNYGYTILDSLLANHRIKMLKGSWPFVKVGEELNYLKLYKPKSFLDSLTFNVFIDENLSLGTVRYKLAQQYDKNERYFDAFKEYNAVIATEPYIARVYRDAATDLINLYDFPQALEYLNKSLEYEESGFAYFKIADIYLFMGDYNSSIAYFQKSYPLISNERKILVLAKVYMDYVYSNNLNMAQKVATELKNANAAKYLEIPQKEYLYDQYIPFQTRTEVTRAKELLLENKDEQALQILEKSLNTYDSHIANRLIGEIYLKNRNFDVALFYFEKVYDQFRFDPNFLYNLALIYHSKNDSNNANKCLQEIKKIEPDYRNLGQLNSILSNTN